MDTKARTGPFRAARSPSATGGRRDRGVALAHRIDELVPGGFDLLPGAQRLDRVERTKAGESGY
ncbi:MAG: hypothetical protein WD766_08370 [Gemmatimonadota bacterium]